MHAPAIEVIRPADADCVAGDRRVTDARRVERECAGCQRGRRRDSQVALGIEKRRRIVLARDAWQAVELPGTIAVPPDGAAVAPRPMIAWKSAPMPEEKASHLAATVIRVTRAEYVLSSQSIEKSWPFPAMLPATAPLTAPTEYHPRTVMRPSRGLR